MAWNPYVVGSSQISGKGDQKKTFVSKSTLLMATKEAYVRFNSMHNVTTHLIANTWYEFKHNIHTIYIYDDQTDTENNTIEMHFEGVMYSEARRPE